MTGRKNNKNKGLVVLLFILIAIFLSLVIVLMVMIVGERIRKANYGSLFTPTPGAGMHSGLDGEHIKQDGQTKTPEVSKEPKTTATPTCTFTPSPTPTPTCTFTPTPTPTPAFSVYTGFSEKLDEVVSTEYDTWKAGKENTYTEVFDNGYYVSVLFETADKSEVLPLVFVKETAEKITLASFIRESYLSVIKERLQKYVLTVDDVFKDTEFISYYTPYKSYDYEKFYMKEDKLIFRFDGDSLIEKAHKAFEYECSLSEASAFMYVNTDGVKIGQNIRLDLDPSRPMVAFTYDDGPHRPAEEPMIDILTKYDARVTFFSLGNRFQWNHYPETLKELSDIGCEICSHTFNHVYFDEDYFKFSSEDKKETKMEEFWSEINLASLKIAETIGAAPNYIRMPGGYRAGYMSNVPFVMINWSVDTKDWDGHGKSIDPLTWQNSDKKEEQTYQSLLKVKDGDIVLMHSVYYYSVKATERAMEELSKKGYQFVNLSELFYYKGIKPENGEVYTYIR